MLLNEIIGKTGIVYSPEDLKKIGETIKKDCSFFLSSIGKDLLTYAMYRGEGGLDKYKPVFRKQKVRKDRKPSDTPLELHKLFNDWFLDEYGIKHRSQSLFATGDYVAASSYGTSVGIIFPIDKYKFVYSKKYQDLTNDIDKARLMEPPKSITDEYVDKIYDFMDNGMYSDTDFKAAIKSENEIMINCNEYYILNIGRGQDGVTKLLEDLEEYI